MDSDIHTILRHTSTPLESTKLSKVKHLATHTSLEKQFHQKLNHTHTTFILSVCGMGPVLTTADMAGVVL